MKRLLSILAVLAMVFSCAAFAEDLFPLDANGRFVLVDQDNILIYLTGNVNPSYGYLYLEAVVQNDSDTAITMDIENAAINGWDVYAGGIYETNPGKKQKDNITFSMEDADITDVSEITDLEFAVKIYDSESYNELFTTDTIVLVASDGTVEAPASETSDTGSETADITAMTDEELLALNETVQAELQSRGLIAEPAAEEEVSDEEESPAETEAPAEEAGPAETEAPAGFTEMKKGDKNDNVKAMQERLIALGYLSGSADGDFGNKSEKAVIAFQKAAGLDATGVVDETTYNAMMADDAPEQIVYEKLPYDTVSRDPDLYTGKHYTFSGTVLQVMENGNYLELRVATRKGYDDVVYVTYTRSDGESRILEDDKITVNGTFTGLKSYTTVMGATVTIPQVAADTIG